MQFIYPFCVTPSLLRLQLHYITKVIYQLNLLCYPSSFSNLAILRMQDCNQRKYADLEMHCGRGAGSSVLLVKLTARWFFMPSQTSQTWNFTITDVDSSAEQLLFIDCMETSWMRDVQTMHL